MAAAKQAFVFPLPLGKTWGVKVDGKQISPNYDTQAVAIVFARTWLLGNGGGELVILGEDGKIRAKDTIYPGNDPRNTRG